MGLALTRAVAEGLLHRDHLSHYCLPDYRPGGLHTRLGRHNSLINRSPEGLLHSSLFAAANSTEGRRGTPTAHGAPNVDASDAPPNAPPAARGGNEGAFDLEFDLEAMLGGPSEAEAEAALLRLSASPEEPHGDNLASARPEAARRRPSSPPAL